MGNISSKNYEKYIVKTNNDKVVEKIDKSEDSHKYQKNDDALKIETKQDRKKKVEENNDQNAIVEIKTEPVYHDDEENEVNFHLQTEEINDKNKIEKIFQHNIKIEPSSEPK